jgi:tetratricopeptide (TPR) repeat protein
MSSKRLAYLEKITSEGSKDPFAWYGLANEYSSQGRPEDALRTFEKLREMDPGYVPQYLICGQMLVGLKRIEEAKVWLTQGLEAAQKAGNGHAASEIGTLLGTLS